MVWGVILSALGVYNITKGMYNMYKDAEKLKTQYDKYQKITEQYSKFFKDNDCDDEQDLTISQYEKYQDDFLII